MPSTSEPSFLEFFNPGALPSALVILAGTVLLVRLLERVTTRIAERWVARRLLVKQLSTILAFVAYVGASLVALTRLFNLSSQALLALSGTIAVMAGLALKDVAASMLAGLTIITNRPFQVGDRISFGGYYGEVKEIGLRTVRLVTLDDNLVTIPSSKFLAEPVASANAGALDCMVVMRFFVTAAADVARAKQIVLDALLASKYLYLGKPYTVLVASQLTERGGLVVELTAKAYVYDTRYEKTFASDVTERVLRAFQDEAMPLPLGA